MYKNRKCLYSADIEMGLELMPCSMEHFELVSLRQVTTYEQCI